MFTIKEQVSFEVFLLMVSGVAGIGNVYCDNVAMFCYALFISTHASCMYAIGPSHYLANQ